jgi:hypothetical protein
MNKYIAGDKVILIHKHSGYLGVIVRFEAVST